jgi:ABC-type lipoprotein release transport system permease subunit
MNLNALILKNLWRHRKSFILATVGIVLGISSFVLFLGLGQGLRQNVLERVFVIDQIEVVPRRYDVGALSLSGGLFGGGTGIDPYTIADLSALPGVEEVYPKQQLSFPSMAWGGQQLFGTDLWVEFIADGMPDDLISNDLEAPIDDTFLFRDWDRDTVDGALPFTCGEGGTEPTESACPPGRTCSPGGICVREQCEPPDEVLASATVASANNVRDILNARLGRRRTRASVRTLEPESDTLGSGTLLYRVAVTSGMAEEARNLLDGALTGETALNSQIVPEETGSCDSPAYCTNDTRQCEMPIPVVASPFLMEVYNTSIQNILSGSDQSIPSLSQDALLGFTFNVRLGQSYLGEASQLGESGGSVDRRIRLVGWSPRAVRLGVTMPLSYVQRFNQRFKGESAEEEYHAALVIAESGDRLANIVDQVENELNLSIGPEYEQAKRGGLMILLLTIGLLIISLVIVLLASLNIGHTFLLVIGERRQEIGLLRSVGATRLTIQRLILTEAGVMGFLGASLGVTLALLFASTIDRLLDCRLPETLTGWCLPDFPFKPDSFFAFNGWIFMAGFIISVLFSILGASIPAYRASNLDPADALRAK